jgi:2-iminobutanoate/2-iminopropanoate deaminase
MMFKISVILIFLSACLLFAFSGNNKKEVIYTDKAPRPIGPYSQAIRSGGTLFVSGQIALRTDGTMDTSNIENECKQVLNTIKCIVEAAGMKLSDVTKASIFTTDLKQFSRINEVYKTYFAINPPARETVEVKALPKDAHVEISVIAD